MNVDMDAVGIIGEVEVEEVAAATMEAAVDSSDLAVGLSGEGLAIDMRHLTLGMTGTGRELNADNVAGVARALGHKTDGAMGGDYLVLTGGSCDDGGPTGVEGGEVVQKCLVTRVDDLLIQQRERGVEEIDKGALEHKRGIACGRLIDNGGNAVVAALQGKGVLLCDVATSLT